MASEATRSRILDALGHLLEPVVLLLLKSGITWREFSDLAKAKFVQVATDEFGIRGRPTNASRVSILTGVDRRDVRKLRLALAHRLVPRSGIPGRRRSRARSRHRGRERILHRAGASLLAGHSSGRDDQGAQSSWRDRRSE
jgi:hypothetical protein